jgi:hypothetical protein
MTEARRLIEELIYRIPEPLGAEGWLDDGPRRFTQDSPVLPDVWIRYVEAPDDPQHLLLTPHFSATAGEIGGALRVRLLARPGERRSAGSQRPRIAYNEAYVATELYFDELVRLVLPMTQWWRRYVLAPVCEFAGVDPETAADRGLTLALLRRKANRRLLVEALRGFERSSPEHASGPRGGPRLSTDLLWMIRVVGTVAWLRERAARGGSVTAKRPTPSQMVDAVLRLVAELPVAPEGERALIWQVNLNRPARTAIRRSTLSIKADAVRRLFDVRCHDLAWGIIDSGIDARHPAFWYWQTPPGLAPRQRRITARLEELRQLDEIRADHIHGADGQPGWQDFTRVAGTYDFTRVADLFDVGQGNVPGHHPEFVERAFQRARDADAREALTQTYRELAARLARGRGIDWGLAEPFLKVPHDEADYEPPRSEHGTHVAGILAADWPHEQMCGVCPDLRLYDLRVLRPGGSNDEFAVLAALQFVRYLNDRRDFFAMQGVNVSLSIRHDVANFACGRTPVCDESERLVGSGVVVVAAAGNEGYLQYLVAGNRERDGYQTVSITDPGNAEAVITVGATHRFQPHTYGVSYFSSRGPTGDGRLKPDLVAPGEKIKAPIPDFGSRHKDGTSMAAPHVSGAAALLMARYSELIGDPARIKQILCESATDLGREPYFQGGGMLDVLRALQAV